MKRHNQILIGLLVLQIALGVFVFWPKSTGAVESEPLFSELEVSDIFALTIADAEGNSVRLEKVDGAWVMPEADNYPAQADKIMPFLEKLIGLTTDRLVTRTDASHARLQVAADDFVRRVEIVTTDGEKHTLYLGSAPRYGALHFRLKGQDAAYLTNDLTTWEANAEASAWVDAAYVSFPHADVYRMRLENANGSFEFEKGRDGTWTMADLADDESLNQAQVTALLRRAASVNLTRPLGKEEQPDYGLDEPNAVAALETMTDTVTLYVGAKVAEGGSYVVKSSQLPYYVEVSEPAVKALVENTRDSFLQQQEEGSE